MHADEQNFSFKKFFIPLTTFKAIHILTIIGLIVYGNMLFNGFVWDDTSYIVNNQDIHSIDLIKIFNKNSFNESSYYRPMLAFYHSFMFSIFNNFSFFYHFFQLIIHIINTALIFLLFKKTFNKINALLLSGIFLIHPIQVESVSYISSIGNPLFFLFGISALLLSMSEQIKPKKITLILLLFFLSLLTKETSILFFFCIILYKFIFQKKHVFKFLIGGGLVIVIYFIIRITVVGITSSSIDPVLISKLDFFERLQNIPAIIFYYLKTLFYPNQLAINQLWTVTEINFSQFYFPLIIDLLFFSSLIFLGIYCYKTNKKSFHFFMFFFTWFMLGILMHIQIYPLNMTVADRWFYFPIVGLLGMTGVSLSAFGQTNKNIKTAGYILLIIFIVLFSLRTMVRNENWRNGINLYTHDSKIYSSAQIENNLGNEYFLIQNYKEAIIHYEKSINMFPRERTYYNLAYTYELLGDREKATAYYAKAFTAKLYLITPHKHLLGTYTNYGRLLLLTHHLEKARLIIETGLTDYPDSGRLWYLLAITEYAMHNQPGALNAIEKAKALLPNDQTNYIYMQIIKKQPITLPVL